MPEKNSFGDGFEEVKAGEFVKFEKPGQLVKGIFVESKVGPNQLKPGQMQKIYTLESEDGTEFRIARDSIDSAMKKVVRGQWVAFLYEKDIPSKNKAHQPFKLIKVAAGQVDTEWLEKNKEEVEISIDDIEGLD